MEQLEHDRNALMTCLGDQHRRIKVSTCFLHLLWGCNADLEGLVQLLQMQCRAAGNTLPCRAWLGA